MATPKKNKVNTSAKKRRKGPVMGLKMTKTIVKKPSSASKELKTFDKNEFKPAKKK